MIETRVIKELNTIELDVSLNIEKGELLTIYGESGAGKTSLLRMLAGLMQPSFGKIRVGNATWLDTEKKKFLKPQKRKVGFVFQDYALFPNMTVRKNLSFAQEDPKKIDEMAERMGITELLDHKPSTLSGGQQQRTALARTLLAEPDILLLDEPLSALDRNMRKQLQDLILEVHQEYKLTTLLVSHDLSEIFRLSNRVLKLEKGKIVDEGTPLDIFTDRSMSGKFQFMGEVVEIMTEDVVRIVTILIGNNPVKVITDMNEHEDLKVGDQVWVASKAFNPILKKID